MKTPRETPGAFTLLELLVVIAIISLLAALIMSVVRSAKAGADASACVSNLRQLASANLRYAAENNGQFVAAQDRKTNNQRWHGTRTSSKKPFDFTKSPLAPYLGTEGRIKLCPSFQSYLKGKATFEEGTGGYGYNAVYVGGRPPDRYGNDTESSPMFIPEYQSAITRADRTIMFTDAAFSKPEGVQEYSFAEPWFWPAFPGKPDPSVHFRHGGKANVAWCDGHVSAESPSRMGGKNSYGGDDAKAQIGWFGPERDNGYWNPNYEESEISTSK